jgi:hypothetical protein
VFGRVVGRVVSAAAALCLLASPAEAAIEADFNGDGVLDRIVLPHTPETNIVVRLSGGAPQVLKLYDRIIAIVATDLNHDGEIDLSALSERKGVSIWLNHGKGAERHLKALKRKHHNRGFSLSTRGPLASAPGSASDGPAATGMPDDRNRSACYERITHGLSERPGMGRSALLVPTLPASRGGACSSRAPPSPLESA